jgi:hypothetical protein
MPDHDVSVMAYLHYDPTLPPNPSESGWDETTGSLLVNKFTTNSLLAAISAVVYNSATNSYDYAKVKAITVVGTLSRYDWEMLIGSRFTNLTYLDVSRTTGLSTTSYDGYDRGYTLTTLLLPATVSTIGYNTFNNFTALRSITCYAATPPKVENNGFSGVPTDATVYVPAESLPLYAEADGWKELFRSDNVREEGTVIRARDITRNYGEEVDEYYFEMIGERVLGMPKITCAATKTSPAGEYPIVVERGSIQGDNVSFVNGKLTIVGGPVGTLEGGEATGIDHPSTPNTHHPSPIYDLQGRLVESQSSKGVVIVNKKKIVK